MLLGAHKIIIEKLIKRVQKIYNNFYHQKSRRYKWVMKQYLLSPPKLFFGGLILDNTFISWGSASLCTRKRCQCTSRCYKRTFLILYSLFIQFWVNHALHIFHFPRFSHKPNTKKWYNIWKKEKQINVKIKLIYQQERDCREHVWTWENCHWRRIPMRECDIHDDEQHGKLFGWSLNFLLGLLSRPLDLFPSWTMPKKH